MRAATVTMTFAGLLILACGSRTSSGGETVSSDGASGSDGSAGSDDGTSATSTSGGSSSGGSTSSSGGSTSSSGGSTSGGTTATPSDSSDTDTSQTSTAIDACEVIDGTTYVSLDEMECGLGPNGPVYCNWHISFDAGTWDWAHSDVMETGGYSCDGNVIDGGLYGGELDTDTGILTWEGADYEPE